MQLRNQIWNRMFNIKFKAIFAMKCSRWSNSLGRWYSIVIVVGTSGSIAAWTLWQSFPIVWAVIVCFAQLLHVLKPYVPYIGSDKEYMDASFQFERLALDYERLYKKYDGGQYDEQQAEDELHVLQHRELDIESKYTSHCPKLKRHINQSHDETEQFVASNYF